MPECVVLLPPFFNFITSTTRVSIPSLSASAILLTKHCLLLSPGPSTCPDSLSFGSEGFSAFFFFVDPLSFRSPFFPPASFPPLAPVAAPDHRAPLTKLSWSLHLPQMQSYAIVSSTGRSFFSFCAQGVFSSYPRSWIRLMVTR